MTQFIYIPFGGGGGPPGSSQDRFAPKYVVGCTAAPYNDSATAYSTAGFYYIPDPGDGTGIALALSYTNPSDPNFIALGDVWIRPGNYLISQTLVVPAGVVVRGSGTPTFIHSVDGAISGPLVTLNHKSALYSMSLAHNEPGDSGGTQYGVVDLRGDDKNALCEDVDVLTQSLNPITSTLFGGFVASNSNGASETRLRCVRCTVLYGLNAGGFDYTATLAGYRLVDAALELLDCTGRYVVPTINPNGSLYVVVGTNAGTGSLTVRGGVFTGYTGGLFLNGAASTRMVVDGAKITASDPNNASTCLGTYRSVNAVVVNNTITETSGAGGSQAILFDAQGVAANTNCGQVTGNRIAVSGATKPWNSIDGYHVFIANSYTGATAPVSAGNDEVAHNINIP